MNIGVAGICLSKYCLRLNSKQVLGLTGKCSEYNLVAGYAHRFRQIWLEILVCTHLSYVTRQLADA